MRIDRLQLWSERRLRPSIPSLVLTKLLKAAAGADGINVPLGKHGAEPGLQRTAPMKVTEKRTFRALATRQTVQLRKKGIGEITSLGGTPLPTNTSARPHPPLTPQRGR